MKKFILTIVVILSFSAIFAAPVDSVTARIVAQNFYKLNSTNVISSITLAYIEKGDDSIAAFYVFNINTHDGYVMVSAEDAATPVLGYNTTGHYTGINNSPEFNYWKDGYKEQIKYIRDNHLKADSISVVKWNKFKNTGYSKNATIAGQPNNAWGIPIVGPLLGTINWNQDTYYNSYCPPFTGSYNYYPTK